MAAKYWPPFCFWIYFKPTLQLICMHVWLDVFLSKIELFLHVMHSWLKDSLKAISRKTKNKYRHKKSLAEKWLPYRRSCLYRNFKDSSGYKIPVYWNYPNLYSLYSEPNSLSMLFCITLDKIQLSLYFQCLDLSCNEIILLLTKRILPAEYITEDINRKKWQSKFYKFSFLVQGLLFIITKFLSLKVIIHFIRKK